MCLPGIKTGILINNKPERRKSSQFLPAKPEAQTLSNAALPGIHQPWLPRRWWRQRGRQQHQLLSEGSSKQREPVAATRDEDCTSVSASATSFKDSPPPVPAGRVGTGKARTTAVPGPCPAQPFSPSGEEGGRELKRRDEAGHEGCDCLYLCAPKRWHWRGPHQLSQGAQSLWVPRAPGAAAATPAPAAVKRGLGSAQLLIIPAESSQRSDVSALSARARTLLLSLCLLGVGPQFGRHSNILSPKFSLIQVPRSQPGLATIGLEGQPTPPRLPTPLVHPLCARPQSAW
ncbi:uncharacterized protein LOC127205208 [Acomys russatus]|uniref:uncharacterized protein LOC127205208 n=1 Tax=Acomys russatus TaxID=60746 RepID=UPI0021E342C4|nr:uncharacterized protein LOC127205208 [Acomys russatus]